MSCIKKQTTLRWSFTNDKTESGSIIATEWTASLGKLHLSVTNFPGSSTLSWKITIPGRDWQNGGDEDRYEFTVSTLKDQVYRKAVVISEMFGDAL